MLGLWKTIWLTKRCLLKRGTTWNDLKRPITNKKRPETTYNDLKRPITNMKRHGNDLQRARNDLKRPTTSKTQPATTRTYLQQAKKDAKRPITSSFWYYFTIWGNRFSSLTRFQPNIWLQSLEHYIPKNHGENRVPNISILPCVFITGYKIYGIVANHFDARKLTFARQ